MVNTHYALSHGFIGFLAITIYSYKAPIYQRAYYLAFDELYRLWIAEQQHSGNSCSEQLTRTDLGHVRETDAAWEPGTILGGMLRFFSLTP